jgi:microcystin-dependent protein
MYSLLEHEMQKMFLCNLLKGMNNIQDIASVVNVINYKTLPSIFEMFANMGFHVGEYKWSARSNDYGNWFVCDGRSLPIDEYNELYEVIGTSFGSNDSISFKLPDLRGRVMGCVGTGANLSSRVIGDKVGSETHTLTTNEIPSHNHTGSTGFNGSHNHGGFTSTTGVHSHTVNDPGHTHSQTTINDDFNNSGTNPPGFTADSAGTMTWNNINSSTTGISINNNGDHTHTISNDGSHAHTITINSTGGGLAHNNMQPTTFAGNVFIYIGFKHVPFATYA